MIDINEVLERLKLYAAQQPASAIDLEQFRISVDAAYDCGAIRLAEAERLLVMIDRQGDDSFPCCGGNDETPREHCMDCPDYPGQPANGEGE